VNLPWTPRQLAQAGTAVIVVLASLVSVRLFIAIDGASHSAGDMLLGFVPNDVFVWALALAGIWLLRRAATSGSR
jgi:flagellar biosynthesis protein FliQ